MREIKFRAWVEDMESMITFDSNNDYLLCVGDASPMIQIFSNGGEFIEAVDAGVLMQWTGLYDRNGVKMFEGDLLNVFFTSNGGEHIHDCIYEAKIDNLYGITLDFKKLLWESFGHNQYTHSTSLTSKYNTIDNDYQNQKYDRLAVKDTWGENHLLRNRWKQNDYSNYIEIIGNKFQHPELLKEAE